MLFQLHTCILMKQAHKAAAANPQMSHGKQFVGNGITAPIAVTYAAQAILSGHKVSGPGKTIGAGIQIHMLLAGYRIPIEDPVLIHFHNILVMNFFHIYHPGYYSIVISASTEAACCFPVNFVIQFLGYLRRAMLWKS